MHISPQEEDHCKTNNHKRFEISSTQKSQGMSSFSIGNRRDFRYREKEETESKHQQKENKKLLLFGIIGKSTSIFLSQSKSIGEMTFFVHCDKRRNKKD